MSESPRSVAPSPTHDVFPNPVQRATPWPFFYCEPALAPRHLAHFQALFDNAHDWEQHQSSLYDGAMSDMSDALDPELKRDLVTRMRSITGLPLTSRVQVSVQRMAPGQDIRPHADPPLVGYEIARVVLQLNPHWRPEHGGLLQVHPDAAGEIVGGQVPPKHNTAVGFVLHSNCYHSVTRVARQRHSVVLYFWHEANTPELAAHLTELCANMDFGALPPALDDVMAEAERTLSEEVSYQAAIVAWILHRWGCCTDEVVCGYRASAWPNPTPAHTSATTALAHWAATLRTAVFDLERWQTLRETLPPPGPNRPAGECDFWKLAFPTRR